MRTFFYGMPAGIALTLDMLMNDKKIQALLNDLHLANHDIHALVTALRSVVHQAAAGAGEEVKYGGLLFSVATPFCGIFAYAAHVSLEFSRGCDLDDPHGVLEGNGKLRRHIKLLTVDDIGRKQVREYVRQAFEKARGGT